MAIFKKNPNELAYPEGKKHWTDVIKNTGASEYIIWRQPEEDFNTNSTLIVMPGEEAIFVNGGVIEKVFENGTYKLSTENYPFISRLRNAFSGGISTFNCVVYFVRKTTSKEILWGTSSPIQVRDKVLGIATEIQSNGAYRVQIGNPAIFLEKLIGNNVAFWTEADFDLYFKSTFHSKIMSFITRALNETATELLGITARLDELSEKIQPILHNALEEYGLSCANFSIRLIHIKDDELRRRFDTIGMDAYEEIRRAQAIVQGQRIALDTLGDDFKTVQWIEILKILASNPSTSATYNALSGLGLGLATTSVFGPMVQDFINTTVSPQSVNPMPQSPPYPPRQGGRFTQQTDAGKEGSPADSTPQKSPSERMRYLQEMLDNGFLTQEEFDEKRKEILASI